MNLTIEESYKVMIDFLEKYYERTKSDDVGGLLGDMMLLGNGLTADPASWNDWLNIKLSSYVLVLPLANL